MDMTQSIQAKSDQLNAEDLMGGPIAVTIADVCKGSTEQPVNVTLSEYPKRAYRPSKSMRRVMVAAWGKDSSAYVGQRMTLYRDPDVKFGGEKVGGIKISHMTGIGKQLRVALTETRGKRVPHVVQPLIDHVTESLTDAQIAAAETVDELRAMWPSASSVQQAQITARANQLTGEASE